MSRCKRCNIDVLDHTITCPLCNGVLERTNDSTEVSVSSRNSDKNTSVENTIEEENDYFESKSIMYPDISPQIRKMKLIIKIIVFACALIEPVLILINYLTYQKVKWSLITGVAMIYTCFTIIHFFRNHSSHRLQMMIHALCIMVLSVLIDIALGYSGWSMDYAIPCTIMALEVAIVVFMIFDRRNWQSYILLQVFAMAFSLIITLFVFTELFHWPLLMFIADAITVISLGATLLFGDKRATTELKRRFRV